MRLSFDLTGAVYAGGWTTAWRGFSLFPPERSRAKPTTVMIRDRPSSHCATFWKDRRNENELARLHKGISMRKTRGFTYLELMVALALFGIAVTGTTRLVVMQSRQMSKVEQRLNYETTSYLAPSANAWARKLGAAAAIVSVAPDPPPAPPVTLIDDGDPGYSELYSEANSSSEVS